MSGLLLIFKVLGMVFGGILAFVLIITAVVLFSPVRYKVSAVKTPRNSDIDFKLRWLGGIFRIDYNKRGFNAKVFWFFSFPKKKTSQSVNKRKEDKKGRGTVILSSIKWFFSFGYKGLLFDEITKLLRKVCMALMPRVLKVSGKVGLENSSDTGCLLGFLGILSGMWDVSFDVEGNFDEMCLEYDIFVKDRVLPWMIFLPLVRFCFSKPARKLIKEYILNKDDKNERKGQAKLVKRNLCNVDAEY